MQRGCSLPHVLLLLLLLQAGRLLHLTPRVQQQRPHVVQRSIVQHCLLLKARLRSGLLQRHVLAGQPLRRHLPLLGAAAGGWGGPQK